MKAEKGKGINMTRKIKICGGVFLLFAFFLSSNSAYADVGAGIVFAGAGLISMFFFISFMEALIYRWMLKVNKTLSISLFTNFCSTIPGLILSFYLADLTTNLIIDNHLPDLSETYLYAFIWIGIFNLTVILEYATFIIIPRRPFQEIKRSKILSSVIVANFASYLMLLTTYFKAFPKAFAVGFIGTSICSLLYIRPNNLRRILTKYRKVLIPLLIIVVIYIIIGEYNNRTFLKSLRGEIVYTHRDGNDINIYKISANGKNKKFLYHHQDKEDSNCFSPRWSANGEKIYFEVVRNGEWKRFEMDSDGKNVKILENQPDFLSVDRKSKEPYPPYRIKFSSNSLWFLFLQEDADIMIENTRSQRKVKIANGGDADWNF